MKSQLLLVFLLGAAAVALAQEPATLQLTPPQPGLGEKAILQLSRTPADSTQWPTANGVVLRRLDERRFEVLPVRVGELWIACFADTLRFFVEGRIETAAAERLHPLRSEGAIAPNWWPTILLVAAFVAPLLWFLWRRWRGRRPAAAFALPLEPPQDVALRALAEIEGSDWLARGEIERWFIEASRVLRAYVAGRYRVAALDWTSAETLQRLLDYGHRTTEVEALAPLLARADGVKFAGDRPSEHAAKEWLEQIRAHVRATAIEIVYSTPDALRQAERFR